MHAPTRLGLLLLALFASLPGQAPPDLRQHIEWFSADVADLSRRYDVPMSGEHRRRLGERFEQEQRELAAMDFEALPHDARIDWLLLDNHIRRELHRLEQQAQRDAEVQQLLPFAAVITNLGEARRRLEPVDPEAADRAPSTHCRGCYRSWPVSSG